MKLKVTDIIKSFSKDDLKNFNEYLSSPFFNKRKIIVSLYEVYKKFYPGFQDKSFTKEKVFGKLFPGKEFNDEVFRNLNSILMKHAEDFLSFINFSGNSLTVKKHLLSEINLRNIYPVFEKNFEESLRILESSEQKDLNYFYFNFDLFLQKDFYNSLNYKFSRDDITASEKNLLAFFVIQILEIRNYILYQCRIRGIDNSLLLKDKFIDLLMENIPEDIKQMPQIRIYYNALKLEQTSNKEYYLNLKSLLIKHGKLIDKDKHYNKYLDMIDYIKRTGSTNDIKIISEIFELRKEIIEKDLMPENSITDMFFLNIVKSGLRVKEFNWINEFICKYTSLLIPKYKEITSNLSLAYFHFEKKDYSQALSYSAQVSYDNNFYNLEVKNLTSRIFFETEDYQSLDNILKSYKMYLSKNRTIDNKTKISHSDFVSSLTKLMKVKEQKKFYKLDKHSEQLPKRDFISRYWIEEKIFEMM